MKRFNILVFFCILTASTMYAQVDKATVTKQAEAAKKAGDALKSADTGEKAWKFDGVLGLNAAATGLVNWTAGGKNNVNGLAYAKLHLLYHKDAIAWETNFDTDFGMTWIDQDEDAFQKSSDNIKLATKFGWEFKQNWYLTALASFQSQYANGREYVAGYNPVISKWLAPSYTDISLGVDWKTSVSGCDFSVYLSPVAGRITTAYVGDAWNEKYSKEFDDNMGTQGYNLRENLQEKYGTYKYDKLGEKIYHNVRSELGLSLKGAIAYKYENLTLGTTLQLFTPYQGKGFNLKEAYEAANPGLTYNDYFEYSNLNRSFGHFDVDWDVAISYQFLKVLNVTLSTSMKYYPGTLIEDKNGVQKERIQFKSVLGVGIGYSF
ncbi:MAG: DUF3078 domain-containing protein [Bacteroidales bacterium]|nr:DUF3078 domain-containing protein [Bacteroidales bacterium]MBQ7672793.1 DUF3078 domain-containing protein [Paludibacteraceae bacterium]